MTNLPKLQNEAQKLRLTSAEKGAMRARVFAATQVAPPSPYFHFSFQFIRTRVLVPALAVLVVFGGGTAYAAEGTLPGDFLYPVKLGLNEQVEAALAITPVAKAQVHAKLAQRRLDEAQALAYTGRLDSAAAATLEANLDSHVATADALAAEVEQEDPGAAAEVKAELETALSVRGEVLARLGARSPHKPTQENSDKLAHKVLARADVRLDPAATGSFKAAMAPINPQTTLAIIDDASTTVEAEARADSALAKTAAGLQTKAALTLGAVQKLFAEIKPHLSTSTALQVEAKLAAAAESMSEGSALLGKGAFGDAAVHFAEVLKVSLRLQALLEAGAKFNNRLIDPLINAKIEVPIVLEQGTKVEAEVIRPEYKR